MVVDRFRNQYPTYDGPAGNAFSITPSNTVNCDFATRAVYIGGTGDLAAVTINDEVVTFVGIPGGTLLPLRLKRVNSTGTTASALVGLY